MPRAKKTAVLVVVALILAVPALSQVQSQNSSGPPSVDILGVHDDSGRGCIGCHAPHKNVTGAEGEDVEALWGSSGGPDYGQKLSIGDDGQIAEIQPTKFVTGVAEVDGVVLCLSCHDGNLSPISMVVGESYSRKMGLTGGLKHRRVHVAESRGVFSIDHPLGVGATIEVGEGLKFANGIFSVTPGTPYADFVANYGWPTLAPMRRANPYGIDTEGRPYLVCTTCHNQHAMSVYHSRAGSRIAGDDGDQSYATASFVNGPYNTNVTNTNSRNASSGAQFCRQCHFDLTNEGNNTPNIRTEF
jgi:hypothetical protein